MNANGCKNCTVGPGKFEGEPADTILLWQFIMDGDSDEWYGNEYEGSGVDFILPQADSEGTFWTVPEEYSREALEHGFCLACVQEGVADIIKCYAAAVFYRSDGFVSSELYDDKGELEAARKRAEDTYPAEDEDSKQD